MGDPASSPNRGTLGLTCKDRHGYGVWQWKPSGAEMTAPTQIDFATGIFVDKSFNSTGDAISDTYTNMFDLTELFSICA